MASICLIIVKTETLHVEKLKTYASIAATLLVGQLLFFQPLIHGQDTLGEAIDCTDVRIEYPDDPTLTREERLRRMDKAFFESLDKFEYCQSIRGRSKAAGGGQSADGSAGSAGESV